MWWRDREWRDRGPVEEHKNIHYTGTQKKTSFKLIFIHEIYRYILFEGFLLIAISSSWYLENHHHQNSLNQLNIIYRLQCGKLFSFFWLCHTLTFARNSIKVIFGCVGEFQQVSLVDFFLHQFYHSPIKLPHAMYHRNGTWMKEKMTHNVFWGWQYFVAEKSAPSRVSGDVRLADLHL